MLKKTMKQVFNKKVHKWLETVTDKKVKEAIKKDLIITGGCFTSMILNEDINDFDCYFRTKETVLLVAQYYADLWNKEHRPKRTGRGDFSKVLVLDGANPSQEILDFYQIKRLQESQAVMISNTPPERVKMIFPSDGVTGDPEEANSSEELGMSHGTVVTEVDEIKAEEVIAEEKYFPVFISSNAITLSDKIQIVVRFYGEPDEVHDTYDFAHTKAYWCSRENKIVIPEEVYETTINKTLRYTGSKYPVCSVFRLRKFINRGWRINAGQLLKICMQISELDLMDINVLEDQLIGVDSLYFMQLIEQFRRKKEKNDSFVLSSGYVLSIIDKIF